MRIVPTRQSIISEGAMISVCVMSNGTERNFEPKEFDRLWTPEDEEKMIKVRRDRIALEKLSNQLAFAGYAPDDVTRRGGENDLYIAFTGLSAKRLAEHILGEEVDLEAYEEEEEGEE